MPAALRYFQEELKARNSCREPCGRVVDIFTLVTAENLNGEVKAEAEAHAAAPLRATRCRNWGTVLLYGLMHA